MIIPIWIRIVHFRGGEQGISTAVGGLDYAAVSVALKRFELCALKDPDVPRSRERLTKLLNVETCPYFTTQALQAPVPPASEHPAPRHRADDEHLRLAPRHPAHPRCVPGDKPTHVPLGAGPQNPRREQQGRTGTATAGHRPQNQLRFPVPVRGRGDDARSPDERPADPAEANAKSRGRAQRGMALT